MKRLAAAVLLTIFSLIVISSAAGENWPGHTQVKPAKRADFAVTVPMSSHRDHGAPGDLHPAVRHRGRDVPGAGRDRGERAVAKRHLRSYLTRFPTGANAEDARALLDTVIPGRIDERVRDMDINGVWASVNFPSQITGFCGSVFSRCADRDLGLAVTRAWNDWFHDVWYSAYPERIVPMGITFLGDAAQGAEEIRRNAARGWVRLASSSQPCGWSGR